LAAAKNGELAAKDGELAALRMALEAQQLNIGASRQADAAEGGTSEHAKKRARLADDSCSPLDDDEILDAVFSYIGVGDYIYTGAVSRRWNGRYTKLCYNKAKEGKKYKLITAHKSALFTAARLQLAMKSSLTISALENNSKMSSYITLRSLEPIAVLTLAREHGLQWQRDLPKFSALFGKLELLRWLYDCGCRWKEKDVCVQAARRGDVDMLAWLQQVTRSWSRSRKREMLFAAGWSKTMSAAKWLRQQGADWPSSFTGTALVQGKRSKCAGLYLV
jgi:hypothetical protein